MNNAINLPDILKEAKKLVLSVGEYIRTESKNFDRELTETKGIYNYVSYVDKTSEYKLVEGLKVLVPDAGFIAEENTISIKGERYNWIIDPLDGTTNFIHGVPCYSISVALTENNIPVLGIIYEINLDECFYAYKGNGAWLNGKRIKVSDTVKFEESFIATGFPYNNYDQLDCYLTLMKHLLLNTRGFRRLGSAATDLAYVACGRFDAFYEHGLSPWDVAAGIIIVEEAGGKVTDFKGGTNCIFGKEINATNGNIHKVLSDAIVAYIA